MTCTLNASSPISCQPGHIFLLCRHHSSFLTSACLLCPELPRSLSVGTCLGPPDRTPWLMVTGHCWLPGQQASEPGLWVRTETPFQDTDLPRAIDFWKQGATLAWITLSDSGVSGDRKDGSGPQIPEIVGTRLPLSLVRGHILPDDGQELQALLTHLALVEGFDLIVTTGGTGVAPRDITPEVTARLVHKRLHGFEQSMLSASLAVTPHAMISRAVVGILGSTLVINLPGSPKAARENLQTVLPALQHTLDKIKGDPSDCGAA